MRPKTFASTLLISAVVMGCASSGRYSQPSQASLRELPHALESSDLTVQLQGMLDRRDHPATIQFTKSVLAKRGSSNSVSDRTRALCEHAMARAQAALGLHLSALSSYQRAYHLLSTQNNVFAATVLEDWADEQMRAGQAARARTNYERLLSGDNVSSSRRQRWTAAFVVACEAMGASSQAAASRARLGPSAESLLRSTRARLADVAHWQPAAAAAAPSRARQGIPNDSRTILPGLRTRSQWSAAPIASNHGPMTKIKAITVHHSALPAPPAGSAGAQMRSIQMDHQEHQGWADIGYHFLIDAQGDVWEGRRLLYQGAHAGSNAPGLNVGNIGVCLMGNFEMGSVPAAQEASLLRVLDALAGWFALPTSAVQPHTHFKASTLCPGAALLPIVKRYRSATFARQ
ncbi:MAG: hypothetical protein ACI9EF_003643 [Pseudohongiellaceae bacterium]|jgi:hypothetical protein